MEKIENLKKKFYIVYCNSLFAQFYNIFNLQFLNGLIETKNKKIVVLLLIKGMNQTEGIFDVRVFVRRIPDNQSEQEKLDDFLSTKNGIYSINMNYKID